jgi:hypothetical protein
MSKKLKVLVGNVSSIVTKAFSFRLKKNKSKTDVRTKSAILQAKQIIIEKIPNLLAIS